MLSVRVSFFVSMMVKAKQIADRAAVMTPGFRVSGSGRATIRMPMNPMTAARVRIGVIRSPRTRGDSTSTHSGEVNSSAKTCASGITVTA